MANALGYVSETKSGFEGALAMMNLTSSIRIEKNADKAAEGQPDYRIYPEKPPPKSAVDGSERPRHQAANMSRSHSQIHKLGRARSTQILHPSKARKVAM